MDCSSIPAASVQDVVPVPELVDGPLDEFPDEFVTCRRQKAAQCPDLCGQHQYLILISNK